MSQIPECIALNPNPHRQIRTAERAQIRAQQQHQRAWFRQLITKKQVLTLFSLQCSELSMYMLNLLQTAPVGP